MGPAGETSELWRGPQDLLQDVATVNVGGADAGDGGASRVARFTTLATLPAVSSVAIPLKLRVCREEAFTLG